MVIKNVNFETKIEQIKMLLVFGQVHEAIHELSQAWSQAGESPENVKTAHDLANSIQKAVFEQFSRESNQTNQRVNQ